MCAWDETPATSVRVEIQNVPDKKPSGIWSGADPGFLKRGSILFLGLQAKKGCPGGGGQLWAQC